MDQHTQPKSDIEIANAARMVKILDIAKDRLGISSDKLEPYGIIKPKSHWIISTAFKIARMENSFLSQP